MLTSRPAVVPALPSIAALPAALPTARPTALPTAPARTPARTPALHAAAALPVMCPDCGAESALDAVLSGQVPACPGCGYRYTVALATA